MNVRVSSKGFVRFIHPLRSPWMLSRQRDNIKKVEEVPRRPTHICETFSSIVILPNRSLTLSSIFAFGFLYSGVEWSLPPHTHCGTNAATAKNAIELKYTILPRRTVQWRALRKKRRAWSVHSRIRKAVGNRSFYPRAFQAALIRTHPQTRP